MPKYTPLPLTLAEQARIEADALTAAFEDYLEDTPADIFDLLAERRLHNAARRAELRARRLEADAAGQQVAR